jgi:hypothetical protein
VEERKDLNTLIRSTRNDEEAKVVENEQENRD